MTNPEKTIYDVFRRQAAVARQLDKIYRPHNSNDMLDFLLFGKHAADLAAIEPDRVAVKQLRCPDTLAVDVGSNENTTRADLLNLIDANARRAAPLRNFRGVLANDDA